MKMIVGHQQMKEILLFCMLKCFSPKAGVCEYIHFIAPSISLIIPIFLSLRHRRSLKENLKILIFHDCFSK